MEDKKVTVTLPCAGLLGIAFVVLRLCGVIAWPWVWVLAPFWMPLALALIICIVILILAR
jgi:hypothetical protein